MGQDQRNILAVNQTAAAAEGNYVPTAIEIDRSDDFQRKIISSTFGVIKNNILQAFWYSTGLDANVNSAYTQVMTDPNQCIEVQGRKFYPHPGVGNLQAYNELGNPSGGCFTLHTMG